MKYYTRTGDDGDTMLVGGQMVRKDDLRVEAYGTLDELMSQIAVVVEHLRPLDDTLCKELAEFQRRLFVAQTLVATADETLLARLPKLEAADIASMERAIDRIAAKMPEMHTFVLPGGTMGSAQCHVARTVCRRAERRLVALNQQQPLAPGVLAFVNRLSDYLFALARYMVHLENGSETFYQV